MQIKKTFPIYEGPDLRRRWTTEAEWRDWLRAHGAYGFRVTPYFNRCCVVFGERRYVETINSSMASMKASSYMGLAAW